MIEEVKERLALVRDKIARIRNPHDIVIVAVTKGFGAETCRAALAAGLRVLGENRRSTAPTPTEPRRPSPRSRASSTCGA